MKNVKSIASTINSRLRRLGAKFGTDSIVFRQASESLSNVAGLRRTKSGYVSTRQDDDSELSIRMQAAKNAIATVTDTFINAYEDVYGDRASNIDKDYAYKNMTEGMLVKMSELSALKKGSYDLALEELYNMQPDVTTSAWGDWDDVMAAVRHPGRRLSEDEIDANKAIIAQIYDRQN